MGATSEETPVLSADASSRSWASTSMGSSTEELMTRSSVRGAVTSTFGGAVRFDRTGGNSVLSRSGSGSECSAAVAIRLADEVFQGCFNRWALVGRVRSLGEVGAEDACIH